MSKNFYITTTLPYVNADPHVGFAMELIRADIIARYKKLTGYEVFFNTGTDEHGQKVYTKAKEIGEDVQKYVDHYALNFRGLIPLLHISPDTHFVRTTDEYHLKAAQEFWKKVDSKGYIYKKQYQVKYCVGCELEKTESELDENGRCLIHPNMEIELIDEENYFFKFSAFEKSLLEFYEKNPDFVIPATRFNEIKAFVSRGLQDFSISRLASKMSWGVPVPGDDTQVMYVWFDALVNYISTLGWPENTEQFEKFWHNGTPVQYCGKDNLRQQSAMWQAMLMAAELPNSRHIIIDGFINSGGQKMSKSLGNVISPYKVVEEYGTDALRYYVARELSSFEDSDMTMEKFKESYNANLANGIGNLASRILALSEKYLDGCPHIPENSIPQEFFDLLETFNIQKACDFIWNEITALDKTIQETEPFKVIKIDIEKGKMLISDMVVRLYTIARMLNPIMPETNAILKKLIKENKKPEAPLFMRKD
jgi:methionyl-tRNA synthetase